MKHCILHILAAFALVGCSQPCVTRTQPAQEYLGDSDPAVLGESDTRPAKEERGAPAAALGDIAPGIDNLFAVVPGVYSGSGPETPEAFDALKSIGVRTIISVDGSRPKLDLAHERGMRYIHLPIGYGDIDTAREIDFARALRDAPGPIYVHCHYGRHRGPAAIAVGLVTLGRMTNDDAAAFMYAAGTSERYPGLWGSAHEARPLSDADIDIMCMLLSDTPTEFPEYQPVSGLVGGMVAIDATWNRLKLIRNAGWQTPVDHPDLAPTSEAGMLADHFRALAEDRETLAEGSEFAAAMRLAATQATALEAAIARTPPDAATSERAYQAVARSCTECHKGWRN